MLQIETKEIKISEELKKKIVDMDITEMLEVCDKKVLFKKHYRNLWMELKILETLFIQVKS